MPKFREVATYGEFETVLNSYKLGYTRDEEFTEGDPPTKLFYDSFGSIIGKIEVVAGAYKHYVLA